MEPVGVADPADEAIADERERADAGGAEAEPVEGEWISRDDGDTDSDDAGEQAEREQIRVGVYRIWRVATDKTCPLWEITDAECAMLTDCTLPVLEKYLPMVDRIPPEVTAAFTLFMVFGPRWGTPRHPPPPDEEQAEDPRDDGSKPAPE